MLPTYLQIHHRLRKLGFKGQYEMWQAADKSAHISSLKLEAIRKALAGIGIYSEIATEWSPVPRIFSGVSTAYLRVPARDSWKD